MKANLDTKTALAVVLILQMLIVRTPSVVLLRGTSLPTKQVKKKESFPKLQIAHNESDKLRINGWRMSPADVDRIHNEGRKLKVVCKSVSGQVGEFRRVESERAEQINIK